MPCETQSAKLKEVGQSLPQAGASTELHSPLCLLASAALRLSPQAQELRPVSGVGWGGVGMAAHGPTANRRF